MYVIATGNAFDGLSLFVAGNRPFNTIDEARTFGDGLFDDYTIIPLNSPETVSEEPDTLTLHDFH